MKQNVAKVETKELKPGMMVRILPGKERSGFEVEGMRQTRGLVGTVITVDGSVDLAQVDVYVPKEARLVHWWYPTSVLERAEKEDQAEPVSTEGHMRLLMAESKLTRLYCRSAVVKLAQHGLISQDLLSRDKVLCLRSLEELRQAEPALCYVTEVGPDMFFRSSFSDAGVLGHDGFLHPAVVSPELDQEVDDAAHAEAVVARVCSALVSASRLSALPGAKGEGTAASAVATATAADGDASDACKELAAAFRVCRLPVEVGRKTFDVSFEGACAVVVTVE